MLTAPNSATPDATAPTNVTRSAPDTRSRRASRALSRHKCAHLPPALPQRLKTPYSESGEARSRDARSHETKHTALHQGTHGCTRTLGQATRRGGVNTPQTLDTSHENAPSSTHEIAAHPASENTPLTDESAPPVATHHRQGTRTRERSSAAAGRLSLIHGTLVPPHLSGVHDNGRRRVLHNPRKLLAG